MNQVQQSAKVDYEFTMRREDVLNDEFDFAIGCLDHGKLPNTQQAQAAWLEYVSRIDAELFGGLRIGTDYDYDLYVGLTLKKCTAQGLAGGKFCSINVELFGSFAECRTELVALFNFNFGALPEFTMVIPK